MTDERLEILLVEDNPYDLELTLHVLKTYRLANDVHIARDGAEALEYLFESSGDNPKPRLILLDLKLPKVDGLQVLERIRSDPSTKSIPVIVLTGSHKERDMVATYQLGVNGYMIKPVDFAQLAQAVRELGLHWGVISSSSESNPGGESTGWLPG